jgi:hypothetical protein
MLALYFQGRTFIIIVSACLAGIKCAFDGEGRICKKVNSSIYSKYIKNDSIKVNLKNFRWGSVHLHHLIVRKIYA